MRPRIDLALLLGCLPVTFLAAQGREVDLFYGRWYQGNQATSYEVRTDGPLGGILSHGFALQVLVHDTLGRRRAFYGAGWELHALRRRATLGPYAIAGVTLGLSTDTAAQALAALWNVGVGVAWRPVGGVALGVEGRYRIEDRGPRGFWRASKGSPDGVSVAAGLSLAFGGGQGRGGGGRASARLPPPEPPRTITGNAADIVRTALDALGTPYAWGGTAENGFDCSGLIQYAYARHGIRLPRMSRDQAAAGSLVTPVVEALRPGDILLFAAQPNGGVTHVGMYVGGGDQTFIHSSNSGVKLSRLAARDPDGAWWVSRWVGARRIVE